MMKQNYLKSLFLMLMMCIGMGAWAEVTDVLDQTVTEVSGTTYKDFTSSILSSGATYVGNCAGDKGSIQLRSSNNNSGIVTKTSGGKVKKITINWNSDTAEGRTLNVYGKNGAYTSASDLYDTSKQGTLLGSIKKGTSTEYELTTEDGNITYIGLRSNSGAMYITSISITWDNGTTTEPTTTYNVTVANDIANGTISATPTSAAEGATVTLTATPADGYEFGSWNVTNASTSKAITVTDNKFTMPAANVNVSATFTTIPEKTIAEFIASEGGKCYLTGTVSNITNTTYGNFDLTDESGTIYIYGCLTPAGEAQKFSTLGVVAGDKIKVLAETYEYYNNTTHEAKNVIFVEELEIEKSQYTVTIETPENGTLVVKQGENVLTSGAKVEEGLTLTVECTPNDAENYRFQNWQYKEDGDWVTMTKTMTRVVTKDIAIRANFEEIPTYAITWSVNGTVVKTENLKEGAVVSAPEVEAINDKVFTGWVATETVAADATPSYVTPTIADKDATYYAVFATQNGSGAVDKIASVSIKDYAEANGWEDAKVYTSLNTDEFTITEGHTAENSTNNGKYYINGNNWRFYYNEGGYFTIESMQGELKSVTLTFTKKESGSGSSKKYPTLKYNSNEVTSEEAISVIGTSAKFEVGGEGGNIQITKVSIVYLGTGTTYSDFTTTVSAPVTKYNVTIVDDIENGTVTVDKETAAEGETITLTITPEDGYVLAQLMVYTDYDDVDVEGNTFVMPASDVEVYAYFAPAASETYTLSELAEADIEPYSMVSVSFDNEIVDIQMDEEEGGYIALKDGDNTFVLQTYYACNAEWTAGGTLSGTWENVYYAEQGGAYILMNDSDEPWAGLTYTAPAVAANGTLTFKATNEDGYWATFSCDKDVIFDANDVIVYTVAVDNNQIVMIEANSNSLSCVTDKTKDEGWVAGYYVQAGAAVLINSLDETVNYYFIDNDPYTENDLNEVETDPEYNMLVPCTTTGVFKAEADGNMYYKLAYGDNTNKTKLGFWWGAENGSGNFKVKAGGAVLCVPQTSGVKGFSFDMAKDEDAIKGVEQKTFDTVIYDMQGRKVSKTQKGLYIINGRKMVK